MTTNLRRKFDTVAKLTAAWQRERGCRGRGVLVCVVLLSLTVGYPEQTRATPLHVAKFGAMLDSGFGGLPPTLLQVRYVFEDRPPFLVVPHEAYYEFQSITVTLNGVEFSATPLNIGVQDDLPLAAGISRDAYFAVGTAAMKTTSSSRRLGSSS